MKIVLTIVLLIILLIVIIFSCHRAYVNEKKFKRLINSRTVRDNIRFIVERYHGSEKAINEIKSKYFLSETMTLRLIHRINK